MIPANPSSKLARLTLEVVLAPGFENLDDVDAELRAEMEREWEQDWDEI
jgi:hypothetical protein